MLAIERRNKIYGLLRRYGRVVVGELAKDFEVSEETIRRDLDKLEKEYGIVKTYGGAFLKDEIKTDIPLFDRKKTNVEAKERIASLIEEVVLDGDAIILDASSTAVFIARKLKNKKNITLITNSVEVLLELSDVSGWKILSTGGEFTGSACALTGTKAEEMLSSYRVDKVVVSCKGLDPEFGFSDSDERQASVKRKMLACGVQKILAVDASKFDKRSFAAIGGFDGIDAIFTDSEPSEAWKELFDRYGVECLYPNE